MLLRRAEHLCVSLAPATVACALWRGSENGTPTGQAVLPCTREPNAPAWQPGLDALRGWLGTLGGRRGRARVVLSNHFVRYVVVPWQEAIATPAERQAFAHHLLHERHGDAAARWHVKVGDTGWGEPAIACAVDEALVQALPGVFEGTGWTLFSVEPLLMVAVNRFRRELGRQAALFVREPERLCCAVVTDGVWRTVHALRADRDTPSEALMDRATHLLGIDADVPRLQFPPRDTARAPEARA